MTTAYVLQGPWELRAPSAHVLRVVSPNGLGSEVWICECWHADIAARLVNAWAIPYLLDVLERVVAGTPHARAEARAYLALLDRPPEILVRRSAP